MRPAQAGFVFCCFDIWKRLLRAVLESVLWLYEANPLMKANPAREAAARGVGPERLVDALPLPP
jgi:predicted O-linked N-acetylglucosamine transferase (SPINDLY family)